MDLLIIDFVEEYGQWRSAGLKGLAMEQCKVVVSGMSSRTSLGTFTILLALVGSPDVLAQQKGIPQPGTNAPWEQRAPAPAIKQILANQLPKQFRSVPMQGAVKPDEASPRPLSRTDRIRPDASDVKQSPNGAFQPTRPRAVHREVAKRMTVSGGILVLPAVGYYGVPVILNVPGIGHVDVPEDEYAQLYEQLSSSDPEQVNSAIASLRSIKAAEDAQIEAMCRRSGDGSPSDGVPRNAERDLSEQISFDGPSRARAAEPSRRLY
jgi:hypothetical protein